MGKKAARATYDDLLGLDEKTRAEVVDGRVLMLPSPSGEHQVAVRVLCAAIGGPFHDEHGRGGPGGWWILQDIDVRFAERTTVRPDVVGWRRDRLAAPLGRPIDVRPDWVCEVLSPSNAAHDLVTKRRLYAEHGVPHYWVVDPVGRTLTALTLEGKRWVEDGVFDEHDVARLPPFEAVELEVGRFLVSREGEPEVEGESAIAYQVDPSSVAPR